MSGKDNWAEPQIPIKANWQSLLKADSEVKTGTTSSSLPPTWIPPKRWWKWKKKQNLLSQHNSALLLGPCTPFLAKFYWILVPLWVDLLIITSIKKRVSLSFLFTISLSLLIFSTPKASLARSLLKPNHFLWKICLQYPWTWAMQNFACK